MSELDKDVREFYTKHKRIDGTTEFRTYVKDEKTGSYEPIDGKPADEMDQMILEYMEVHKKIVEESHPEPNGGLVGLFP
jgi:hypothetical protein